MLFLSCLFLLGTTVLCPLPVQSQHPQEQTIPVNHVPYQATLNIGFGSGTSGYQRRCGAVLIAPEWLLTAEHCLTSGSFGPFDYVGPIEVFLGFDRIDYLNRKQKEVVKRRVVRHFRGPRIGSRKRDSGILLMKLDEAVPTSANIRPIELPETSTRWRDNQSAIVTGFGWVGLDDYYTQAEALQYTEVPILSKRDCLEMYRKSVEEEFSRAFRRIAEQETMLCAGTAERNICFDHSGGPLAVCMTNLTSGLTSGQLCKDNRWLLAGIESFSYPCGVPEIPGVYVNVAVFSGWIRRTINKYLSKHLFDKDSGMIMNIFEHGSWLFRDPQFTAGWATMLGHKIKAKDTTLAIAIVILMFCLPKKPFSKSSNSGESNSLLAWNEVQSKLAWGVVLLRGDAFSMANIAQSSSLTRRIGSHLDALEELPTPVVVMIVCILASFCTELAGNSAIPTIFLPISSELARVRGVIPLFFLVPVTIRCLFAFILPVGTPANALIAAHAKLTPFDMVTPGVIVKFLCLVVMFASLFLIGVHVFDLNAPLPAWAAIQNGIAQNVTSAG